MRPRADDLGRGASREPATGESDEAAQHTAAAGTRPHDRTTRLDNTTAAAGGWRANRERTPDRGAGEGGQRPTTPRMGASPPPKGYQRRAGAARAPAKRRGDRRSVATKGGAGGAGGTTPRRAKRDREGGEPSKRSPPKRRARSRTKERDAGASEASVSPETKDLDGLYMTCVAIQPHGGCRRERAKRASVRAHLHLSPLSYLHTFTITNTYLSHNHLSPTAQLSFSYTITLQEPHKNRTKTQQ